MAESKIYLNVPFSQKDAAKALGAKWDAVIKKWYVPAGKDCALFAQWQDQSATLPSASTTASKAETRITSGKAASSANNDGARVITRALDKNFVAYNGDEPPWD